VDADSPAPCPRCGRKPIVIPVLADPNFYRTAERLEELRK
jgi:hypothetical protein